jgi:outer membrane protein assembly factor BamD
MRSVAGFASLTVSARVAALAFAVFVAGCSALAVTDETIGWSAEKMYNEAKDEMNAGNWNKAAKLLEKVEARFPYGRYAQQAQMDLAYAYYKDNEFASSIAACDRFIKLHPGHPNVDYVYYLKGLVSFNDDLGLLGVLASQDLTERDPKAARDSFDAFKDLVQRFPESKYTPDALLRMSYLVNALAGSEVHIARYYLRRGAYLAAANRAQATLRNYPDAPVNEEALAVMIEAYDKLGTTDLRDDARRVLARNFPNSRFLAGYTQPAKSWYKLW